jgi:hypothetical protein
MPGPPCRSPDCTVSRADPYCPGAGKGPEGGTTGRSLYLFCSGGGYLGCFRREGALRLRWLAAKTAAFRVSRALSGLRGLNLQLLEVSDCLSWMTTGACC